MMLNLIAPAPLRGLSRDNHVMALLTRIASIAEGLTQLSHTAHVPPANVRADANRILSAADEARRVLVRAHQERGA